jgi:protein-L-isoaspartate(D-aspartate) O-methyltransferase
MDTESMIATIKFYGLENKAVFDAMRKLPREKFISPDLRDDAYGDYPLPTLNGQTISQPSTVALMLDALELHPGLSVLEIGSGSGWALGLIKLIVGNGKVTGLEFDSALAKSSRSTLKKLDVAVQIIKMDGSIGYAKNTPYDRILVSAACPEFPKHLLKQLKEGGVVIAPVGKHIHAMVKFKNGIYENLGDFRFVPLKGSWAQDLGGVTPR